MADLKQTEVMTQPCRLAFPSLFVPTPVHKTTPDKLAYQATVLVPPDAAATIAALRAAIEAACMAKWGKVIPLSGDSMPVKKCNGKYQGFLVGWLSVKAKSSKLMPETVDQAKQPVFVLPPNVTDADRKRLVQAAEARVYPGAWCRFYLNAFAWDNAAGKGVSFSLNAVQLVRDGERLDGRKSADSVFDTIDTGDERPAAAAAPTVGGGDDFFDSTDGPGEEETPW